MNRQGRVNKGGRAAIQPPAAFSCPGNQPWPVALQMIPSQVLYCHPMSVYSVFLRPPSVSCPRPLDMVLTLWYRYPACSCQPTLPSHAPRLAYPLELQSR